MGHAALVVAAALALDRLKSDFSGLLLVISSKVAMDMNPAAGGHRLELSYCHFS
jgi:hypothetical protein